LFDRELFPIISDTLTSRLDNAGIQNVCYRKGRGYKQSIVLSQPVLERENALSNVLKPEELFVTTVDFEIHASTVSQGVASFEKAEAFE
jgi:hypothetical protein